MKKLLAITALALTFFAPAGTVSTCVAQTVPATQANAPADASARSAQVDALLASFNQGNTPGVAVTVIQNGEIVHRKGYGLARLEPKETISADTAFDLASTAKPFTAMAVMILVDRGKLSFDDPLSKFFSGVSRVCSKSHGKASAHSHFGSAGCNQCGLV